jgi:hypothetical protein
MHFVPQPEGDCRPRIACLSRLPSALTLAILMLSQNTRGEPAQGLEARVLTDHTAGSEAAPSASGYWGQGT